MRMLKSICIVIIVVAIAYYLAGGTQESVTVWLNSFLPH
jgi:hypothetical protein